MPPQGRIPCAILNNFSEFVGSLFRWPINHFNLVGFARGVPKLVIGVLPQGVHFPQNFQRSLTAK